MSYYDNLTNKQKKLVKRYVNSNINFISGTMAPAVSCQDENSIESFKKAMEYYENKGVSEVVVQIKHMGSRCQLYISTSVEKCYAITRNGFIIKSDKISHIFEERIDYYNKKFNNQYQLVIEDGELMPWSFLAGDYIDKDFKLYSRRSVKDLSFIIENGFSREFKKAITKNKNIGQLNKFLNYGHECSDLEITDRIISNHLFNVQVDIFGVELGEYESYFEPFNTLKVVYNDGKESILVDDNNDNLPSTLHNSSSVTANTTNWSEDALLSYVRYRNLEGVVIKPVLYKENDNGIAPYLKVRNPEYLRLVYGPNYDAENVLKKHIKRKSTGKKLGASIKEYKLGKELLKIPYHLCNNNNNQYIELVSKAISTIDGHNEILDPRL